MNEVAPIPRIGVGVIVMRRGQVLLGQRIGAHGAGTWALPGGHLEFGETVAQCAAREVLEETGLTIESVTAGPWTSDVFEQERKHYVTLFAIAYSVDGEPQACEPDKCAGWQWFAWSELPQPLFAPLQSLLRTGYAPVEPAGNS